MNARTPFPALQMPADGVSRSIWAVDRAAFISLALTQRRIAGQYRIWAREAESAGKLADYRKYALEARRLFRDARWHITHARTLDAPAIALEIAA